MLSGDVKKALVGAVERKDVAADGARPLTGQRAAETLAEFQRHAALMGANTLFIPSQDVSFAYGDRQVGALIPPGSTLIFEVELADLQGLDGGATNTP